MIYTCSDSRQDRNEYRGTRKLTRLFAGSPSVEGLEQVCGSFCVGSYSERNCDTVIRGHGPLPGRRPNRRDEARRGNLPKSGQRCGAPRSVIPIQASLYRVRHPLSMPSEASREADGPQAVSRRFESHREEDILVKSYDR